jgi:hypothetical protein
MIHYRAIFDDLVAMPRTADPRPVAEVTVVDASDINPRRRAS